MTAICSDGEKLSIDDRREVALRTIRIGLLRSVLQLRALGALKAEAHCHEAIAAIDEEIMPAKILSTDELIAASQWND